MLSLSFYLFIFFLFFFVDFPLVSFRFLFFIFSCCCCLFLLVSLNAMLFALLYWFGIQHNTTFHIPFCRIFIVSTSFHFGLDQTNVWCNRTANDSAFCVGSRINIFASNKNDNDANTHTNNGWHGCSAWFCYWNQKRTNTHSHTSLSLIVAFTAGRHLPSNWVILKHCAYELFACVCVCVYMLRCASGGKFECGLLQGISFSIRKPNA